jgi:alpha-D-ribose 1-methylphosphonate 5-triphosphate synthase subunit PhnG
VGELQEGLRVAAPDTRFTELRAPEVGLVMLRGRIGGRGAPFNVGEARTTASLFHARSRSGGVLSDWIHLRCIQPLQPGDENYANYLAVPVDR